MSSGAEPRTSKRPARPGGRATPGQALDRAQRVAARAGNAIDLAALERAPRDLARRPFAGDRDLEPLGLGRQPIDDFGRLTGDDLLVLLAQIEAFGEHEHVVATGGQIFELETPLRVREHALLGSIGRAHHDFSARERSVGGRDPYAALEIAGRGLLLGFDLGSRFRRRRGLERELVLEIDLDGDRFAVARRRLEHELEHRRYCGFVETMAGGLHHLGSRHLAARVDRDLQDDVGFEPRLFGFGRVRRVLEVHDFRHHDLRRRGARIRRSGPRDRTRAAAWHRALSPIRRRRFCRRRLRSAGLRPKERRTERQGEPDNPHESPNSETRELVCSAAIRQVTRSGWHHKQETPCRDRSRLGRC